MRYGKFLIIAFFAALMLHARAAEKNLISNGDLSRLNVKGIPVDWNGTISTETQVIKNAAPGGLNAFKLIATGKAFGRTVSVTGGRSYRFRWKVKNDFANWRSASSFQIIWRGKDRKILFNHVDGKKKTWKMSIKNLQGSRDWQEAEMICKAPAEAGAAEIRLAIAFDRKKATVYYADIRMEELPDGDPFANRAATIPYIRESITFDKSILTSSIWEKTAVFSNFLLPKIHTPAKAETIAHMFYDSQAIYIRFNCMLNRNAVESKSTSLGAEESCEIFLQHPGQLDQLQIFLSAKGKCLVFTEKWNDGHWPMKLHRVKNNGGIKTFLAQKQNGWMVAARIPFSALGRKTPLAGEVYRFNLCRSHYYKDGVELSSWSAIPDVHFQYPGGFAKLIFERTPLLTQNLLVDGDGAGGFLINPTAEPANITLSLVNHRSGKALTQTMQQMVIPGGKKVPFRLKCKADDAELRHLEIRQDHKLIAKHNGMPSEKYFAFAVFDPEGVRTQTIYLATDIPYFWATGFRHNGSGRTKYNIIDRKKSKFDLVITLPEEIDLKGMVFDYGDWLRSAYLKPVSVRKNGNMVERRFELPFVLNFLNNSYMFFYECHAKPDVALQGSYVLIRDGVKLGTHHLDFKTIRVGKMRRHFTRFTNDCFYLTSRILRYIFPENTLAHYKSIGMNRLTFFTKKGKSELYQGNTPETAEEYDDMIIREMRETGNKLYYTSNSSSATPVVWRWTKQDPDARAIGANKKPAPYDQFGYPSLCPSYRGKHFVQHRDLLANSVLFRKYKCTWLTLDLELWSPKSWKKLCFCDRCLKAFAAFAPAYAKTDAAKMFRAGKDKTFLKKWEAFKTHQHAAFIRDLTGPVRAVAEENLKHGSTSTRDRFLIGEWRRPAKHLLSLIDYFEMPFYYTPDVVYKNFKLEYDKWGDSRKFLYPTFTFGQTPFCPDFHMQDHQIAELIYEAAIFGGQGICWYFYYSLEPRRLRSMIEGLNTIVPFENIIIDGRIVPDAVSNNPRVQVTTRKWQNERLMAVRAYGSDRDQRAVIRFKDCKTPMTVYCAKTAKPAGVITPEKPEIKLTIPKGRCRLYYIGTTSGFRKRMQ